MVILKGDGLVLKSGSRFIAEGGLFNRGNALFDDWRVAAWSEDHEYRFPIQLIAIKEIWRNGVRVDGLPEVQQLELWEVTS